MKIRTKRLRRQVCQAAFLILILAACSGRKEETPAMPPLTSPLTQAQIGFGVVNVSYTRVNSEPDENSVSPGHLRQGAVVKILERRQVRTGRTTESWVLVERTFQGWVREALVDIYDNEHQANTASQQMRN